MITWQGKLAAVVCTSLLVCARWGTGGAWGLEHVELRRDEQVVRVSGEVLVEAADGGLLLLARDGALWLMQSAEIVRRERDESEFQPCSPEELAARLLEEFPTGFRIHQTANYVICYNTSTAYAQWCGGLYERLYRAFQGFWRTAGVKVDKPQFPLVALIFDGPASYHQHAGKEVGEAAASILGYYNIQTNRVTMYDLTGADELRQYQPRGSSTAHINRILSQPAAERLVATIVHEATHQLAYNSGLQTRLADNPMWVSEGIAIYFETPDLGSAKGWRGIGAVHPLHLNNFRQGLVNRPADALAVLLTDDARFRDARTAGEAYAESWALNYYLLRARRADYARYLSELAQQAPLVELSSQQRLAHFRRIFGDDLAELDRDFVRFMGRVR